MFKTSLPLAICLILLFTSPFLAAQQTTRVLSAAPASDDSLAASRQQQSKPVKRLRVNNLGKLAVRNGDRSTQSVSEIAVMSFAEQDEFAQRMNKADLVNSSAIVALPEVEDEVLVFKDSIVIRRSTSIIVIDPGRVASESELFRSYLGEQQARKPTRSQKAKKSPSLSGAQAVDLDAEERAGLQAFMTTGVNKLDPRNPLRAAAAQGEAAVIEAIIAGKGTFTVEDTLIIPTRSGLDPGANVAIPTIRDGLLDLLNPEPVKELSIKGLGETGPDPMPQQPMTIKTVPVEKEDPPARQPLKPKHQASGKKKITTQFLLGMTRAANFQWERKWSYTSGFFRLTLGSGYAIGYRVPVSATSYVEPYRGYIQDYSDKNVVIGVSAFARVLNGDSTFYRDAGLSNNLVHGGKELLLEANVGFGYKFRAFWKTISSRPYTAIGVSYSQHFTPPNDSDVAVQSMLGGDPFGMTLDPKTTKASVKSTFVDGTATIKFDGKAWGSLNMDVQTLLDGKVQNNYDINTHMATAVGVYPYKISIKPVPLRQGNTTQTRSFGIRFTNPQYSARLIVTPRVKFGFRVGYKKLSAHFSTGWITLNNLQIDTGNLSLNHHEGTRSQFAWNKGEKIYRKIKKPDGGPAFKQ